jgi:hypothetical protein
MVLTMASASAANGRFPRAQYLKESATDRNALILSATYGLLVTADRGKNWYLVCERGLFGKNPGDGDWIDPFLELTPSGVIFSGSNHAVRASSDRACSFATVSGLPVDWSWLDPARMSDLGNVFDLSLEPAVGDKAIVALVSSFVTSGFEHRIFESVDNGATWAIVGKPIAAPIAQAATIDVDPTDPKRLYVTGRGRSALSVFGWSLDRGETWSSSEIPGTEEADNSYIAAIAPSDPNSIWVRTSRWLPDPDLGGEIGDDALAHSTDGGKTWTEVLRKKAKLMGFALSPDGKTVLAGYGDTNDPSGRRVEEADMGVYRASAGTSTFVKIFDASVTCLAWNKTGVYVCASQDRDHFHLGFAPDASFQLGQPNALEPLLKLPDVRGPLPWQAGAMGDVCAADWIGDMDTDGTCRRLGACGDGGLPAPGSFVCGASGSPDAAADRVETGGGGGAGSGGTDAGSGAGAGGTTISDGPSDDCGCRVYATSHHPSRAWALLLAAVALVRRRPRSDARWPRPAARCRFLTDRRHGPHIDGNRRR